MSKKNTKLNYLYSVTYSVLNMILPLITSPYISRVIGAEGLGIYSYNYSIANYFMLFAMLGINNYGNRNIAKTRDNRNKMDKIFSEIYTMQVGMSLIVMLAYLAYTFFVVKENLVIAYIQIFMVISPAFTLSWFFMGLEEFKITVTRNFILKILTFVAIFVFVKTKQDLWKYTLIMSLGFLLSEGVLIFIIHKYVTYKRPNLRDVVKHIKPNLILFIPVIAVSIYRTMDKIMLKEFSTYSQVGFYTNTEKIINICLAFVTALGQVMLPKMSNMLDNNQKNFFLKMIRQSMKLVFIMTIAMCFGIFGVAEQFVPVFFGEGYQPCILILRLLSINLLFLGWGNVLKTQYLIPKEEDWIYIKSVFCGVVVNLLINLALISKYAAIGAVIGTISAEAISLLVIYIYIRKELDFKQYIADSIPYIFIGIFMMIGIELLNILKINQLVLLLIKIIFGVSIFASFTLIYWIKTKDEFYTIILKMISKLKKNKSKI